MSLSSADEAADISAQEREFHLQEHKLLREEIYKNLADMRLIQRAFIIGFWAYLAWASSDNIAPGSMLPQLAAWLPFMIAYVFRDMSIRRVESIVCTAEYLRAVEAVLANKSLRGWETFLEEGRSTDKGFARATRFDRWFWNGALFVTAIFAIFSLSPLLARYT
jgi:hypothetical protein